MSPQEYRRMLQQLTRIETRQKAQIVKLQKERSEIVSDLYETDFYAWTQQQAEALAQGDVASLDFAHLAEEIESLGASERRALRSSIQNVIIHLLKIAYTEGNLSPQRGWQISLRNARRLAKRALAEQPSLRRELETIVATAYDYAKEDTHDQLADHGDTHAPFPDACPWTIEQILDDNFFPEA